jgi:catechol 2,3-dioxygenase-like lactoylglutathione lyase family enzyme
MFETEHLNRAPFEGPIWFSHVALVSPDLDRLIEFYSLLLDAKPDRRTNSASGPTFDAVADYDDVSIRAGWFDIGNMILEMWEFTNPKTPQPKGITPFDGIGYNKVAFEVTDIQREYARLRAAGVAFLSEPVLGDECAEVYLRDPDGNLLSLIQPTAESPHSVTRLKQKTW